MYCSNIVLAHNKMVSGEKKIGVNIISNPMDHLPETKVKMTNVIAARDSQFTPAKIQHKTAYTCVNIPSSSTQVKQKTQCTCVNIPPSSTQVNPERDSLPFVVPNVERSRVNIPVVDFRYYNNKPVYQGTTLPLTQEDSSKPSPLTVWHGLLFSLIIIVGTILGAFAGYGLYKACQ